MAKKNPAAVALGRKGGKNSRKNLSEDERKTLAQKAAAARWGKEEMTANPAPPRSEPVESMLTDWHSERPELRKWIIPEHHTIEGLFTVWVFERHGETTYKSERSVSYEAPTEVRCACARLAIEALERMITEKVACPACGGLIEKRADGEYICPAADCGEAFDANQSPARPRRQAPDLHRPPRKARTKNIKIPVRTDTPHHL